MTRIIQQQPRPASVCLSSKEREKKRAQLVGRERERRITSALSQGSFLRRRRKRAFVFGNNFEVGKQKQTVCSLSSSSHVHRVYECVFHWVAVQHCKQALSLVRTSVPSFHFLNRRKEEKAWLRALLQPTSIPRRLSDYIIDLLRVCMLLGYASRAISNRRRFCEAVGPSICSLDQFAHVHCVYSCSSSLF